MPIVMLPNCCRDLNHLALTHTVLSGLSPISSTVISGPPEFKRTRSPTWNLNIQPIMAQSVRAIFLRQVVYEGLREDKPPADVRRRLE